MALESSGHRKSQLDSKLTERWLNRAVMMLLLILSMSQMPTSRLQAARLCAVRAPVLWMWMYNLAPVVWIYANLIKLSLHGKPNRGNQGHLSGSRWRPPETSRLFGTIPSFCLSQHRRKEGGFQRVLTKISSSPLGRWYMQAARPRRGWLQGLCLSSQRRCLLWSEKPALRFILLSFPPKYSILQLNLTKLFLLWLRALFA